MTIESLRGITEVDGYNLVVMDDLRKQYPERFTESGGMDYKWFESTIRPKNFVYVRHDVNSIAFTIQDGPANTSGVNGCQVTTLLEVCAIMLNHLDNQLPHTDNVSAKHHLSRCLEYLHMRTQDRVFRGVEGTDAP